MMLKQEDSQIQKHISKKSGQNEEENSFSSGDDESSEDEAMKMALQQSQKDAEADQKRRMDKYGGSAQYQAMSETDGFKLAMELSKKDTMGGEEPKEKKKKVKPTP